MKIAIVIGHNSKNKGSYSEHLKMTEFEFNSEVANSVNDADVYFHNPTISSYRKRMKETASRINKKKYDLVIFLHFNSFNTKATGVEVFYYRFNLKGKKYASKLAKTSSNHTDLRNRGSKAMFKWMRGFWALFYPKATCILFEPFFGDNKTDCEKIESPEKVAEILNEFIVRND